MSHTTETTPLPDAARTDASETELRAVLGAKVVRDGEIYDRAVAVWSASVTQRPAFVVACESALDVQNAVRLSTRLNIPLSVRGGGHDWAGRSIRQGGVMLDLTRLDDVTVEGQTASVGGGATSSAVLAAAHAVGMTAVTGTVGSVGFAGLALGGGYGRLVGQYGLAADTIVGATVVLADGRIVDTDSEHEPDLLWALTGGGGNFGVVTELRVRLHPITDMTTGFLAFPVEEGGSVLRGWRVLAESAPDELAAMFGAMCGPDGTPFLFMAPSWSGTGDDGQRALQKVRALGHPFVDTEDRTSIADVVGSMDGLFPTGRHYELRTRNLTELTDGAIDALLKGAASLTSPFSALNIHHFHGAATRVDPAATAFGLRREHLLVEIIAAWDDDTTAATHRDWLDRTTASFDAYALPGGYPNTLGPDERARADRAYGDNGPRLLAAKHHYDPDGVFQATSLPRGR